jgi:hypothetical protein
MNARLLLGAALAAVSVLAGGCSTGSSSPSPGLTPAHLPASLLPLSRHSTLPLPYFGVKHRRRVVHSWMNPNVPTTLVYVSDSYENDVEIYDEAGSGQTPVGQITGFNQPEGLWVSVTQNLWVANTNNQTLLGYRRGSMTPFRTLTDPNGYPDGVCGNDNKSLIYGLDIASATEGPGQTINVYDKQSNSPASVLTDTNAEYLFFCAVDSRGNLFVTLSNAGGYGEVDEFPKGSTAPTVIASNLVYPLGITIDKYNALTVIDAFAGAPNDTGVAYIYDPPYTGGPAYSFTLNGLIAESALDKPQTHLWGADPYNEVAQEWSYPSGTFVNETSNEDLAEPLGIALTPAKKQ